MWRPGKRAASQKKRIDSLIGEGTVVSGDVAFTGGLRIDGHVRGNVTAKDGEPSTLVVSAQARIDGEIRVSHVVVNGTVNGPVCANDYLELQPKARIAGDVTYKTLEMHVGAVIQGRLLHAEPGSASVVELRRAVSDREVAGPGGCQAPAATLTVPIGGRVAANRDQAR